MTFVIGGRATGPSRLKTYAQDSNCPTKLKNSRLPVAASSDFPTPGHAALRAWAIVIYPPARSARDNFRPLGHPAECAGTHNRDRAWAERHAGVSSHLIPASVR